jgi:hypothetical protein
MTPLDKPVCFALTVATAEATLYHAAMPPMPVPRVGEDVLVPGLGTWRVEAVRWCLPSMGALRPTMGVDVTVSWPASATRPAPTYDEDRGWETR